MYNGKLNGEINARCPYYRSEFVKSITCQGIGDATIMFKFPNEGAKDEYLRQQCFRYPNECPICFALEVVGEEE